MRRFVDQQPTRVCLDPVPATEIVGAVAGVQQPLEIDAVNVTDDTVLQERLDLRAHW